VQGCTLVLHTASPFPAEVPANPDDLIKPAVEGTLSILRAVAAVGTHVKRVVVTSSCAAVGGDESADRRTSHVFGENDWTNISKAGPYPKSKTMAERAAWDFWKGLKEPKWSLTTINPALVIGPALGKDVGTSITLVNRVLGGFPAAPHLALEWVDVRDVARAEILVLIKPVEVVSGRRFILCAVWMVEIGRSLHKTFGAMGYRPPVHEAPNFAIWLLSWFDKQVALIYPGLGKCTKYDNTPSKEVLGIAYRDIDKTMADGGHSSIHYGHVKKTPKYSNANGWDLSKATQEKEVF